MRIATISIYTKTLPVVGGSYRMATSALEVLDTTVVKIVSDSGLTGWGETCPLGSTYQPQHAEGARAALRHIAPHLIGQNATEPATIGRTMDGVLSGHGYAKAAIDIAVTDLAARHFRVPVASFLGGAQRDRVPSYGVIGVGSPDEAAASAIALVAQGFRRLQIKIGGQTPEIDAIRLTKVHDAVGPDARLVADANRSMTVRDAMLFSALSRDVPLVLEQPCDSLSECRALKDRLHHPMALDECIDDLPTALTAIATGACDSLGLKITRLGGLTAMRALRDACAAHSMPHTCDDSWGGDIIAAACVHLGATVNPHLLDGVWIAAPYIDGHYDQTNGIQVENGEICVPTGPGLGILPDEAAFGAPLITYD